MQENKSSFCSPSDNCEELEINICRKMLQKRYRKSQENMRDKLVGKYRTDSLLLKGSRATKDTKSLPRRNTAIYFLESQVSTLVE